MGSTNAAFTARLNSAYSSVTAIIALLGLFWLAILLVMQWWTLAAIEAVLTASCVLTWLLIRSNRHSVALTISQLTGYLVILAICLIFDLPNDAAPRVTHLFLLPIALLGYINNIRRPSALQVAMIGVTLLTFVIFSSTNAHLPFATPLPDSVRVPGSWINSIAALTVVCGCIYSMQAEFARNASLVRELQAAVLTNQFELFYQPQVDRNSRATGAEALLRWRHPKRGYIPPLDFIPAAELNGQMTEIGHWVIKEACRTLISWAANPDHRDLRLAINVSASQFLDPDFEQIVLDETARAGIDRTRLKLELTESVMVANVELVATKMKALAEAGIGTALDDFGTGYSSLGYLKGLPLEQLKIDRSFVQDVLENERSAALARSVIHLGSDLGMSVLAEGIETRAQFEFLRDSGCNAFQGFLFGRPAPLSEFELLVMHLHSADPAA